jgi:hypothetical protein
MLPPQRKPGRLSSEGWRPWRLNRHRGHHLCIRLGRSVSAVTKRLALSHFESKGVDFATRHWLLITVGTLHNGAKSSSKKTE